MSIMDMPQMSGVSLRLSQQAQRRSSMFESHPRSFHGKVETHSRGSFSLKGLVDPAVGLIDKSQEVNQSESSILSQLPGVPNDLVYQTESKETIDSSAMKKKIAPQFENTFQLEPLRKPTRKELGDMLSRVKGGISADKLNCGDFKATTELGKELANQVVEECHKLDLARYRFLCMSTVISREGASAQQASRQLWDHNRDTWDETSITLPHAHIFLQLYCVYFD